MSESEPSYLYDVFISYSHRDADWVTKTLVPRLEQGGLRVCTDRDFVPGKPAVLNIEESIRNSRKIILVLSPNWVESQWTHFEAQLAQQDDPAGIRARTIPVLWKPCNIPENLRPLTWIDFTRKSNLDHAWRTLLKAVGLPDDKIRSPRSKPVVRHPVTRPKRKRSAHWRRAKKRKNLFLFSVLSLFLVSLVVCVNSSFFLLPRLVSPEPAFSQTVATFTFPLPFTDMPFEPTPSPQTPVVPTSSLVLPEDCISAETWMAFTTDSTSRGVENKGGCWELIPWGIGFSAGQFSLLGDSFVAPAHYGLSRRIPRTAVIQLTLRTIRLQKGEIWLGIGASETPLRDSVILISMGDELFAVRSYDAAGLEKFSSRVKISPLNGVYSVEMTIVAGRMTLDVNTWSLESLSVPYPEPRFYLGYRVDRNGIVNATISQPIIREKISP